MLYFPIIKGRRVNKIMCLVFLAMALLFLIAGGICAAAGESEIALVLCFLAAIIGAFSLFFGVSWYISARSENKRQKKIEHAAELLAEEDDGSVEYREFILPYKQLTEIAAKRFRSIASALAVTALAVFFVLYIALLLTNGYGGIGHLASAAVFSILLLLPGLAVQSVIYRKYVKSVPHKIMLFPGKLIVDGRQFTPGDIGSISVSSYKSANRSSAAIYRKLIIKTDKHSYEYTIDFRSDGNDTPRWYAYGEMLTAIQKWSKQNRTELTVDYMN